jgi:FixJ family two-component response regulator
MSNQHTSVVVVDDDPEVRASIKTLLSSYGYCVETFDSAEAFLIRAPTCRAICLVVDIDLRDISGVELAHELAAEGFKFPIIFMTGHDDPVIKRNALAAGGIALLHKPFLAMSLIDAIDKATR